MSVALGLALLTLSVAAAIFTCLHSRSNTSNDTSTVTSEVTSVWKAVCYAPIQRLPSTLSQRVLMAVSFLLGLIFVTIFCSQLFALTKSKPRIPSVKTLHDLQDSDLPIYSVASFYTSILDGFANTSLSKLGNKLKIDKMYENRNYLDPNILNITDRALLYTGGAIRAVSTLLKNRPYLQYFEDVREPLFETNLMFTMPIGSVYFEHFNQLSLRLIEGGIYRWWLESNAKNTVQHISEQSVNSTSEDIQGSRHQTHNSPVPLVYNGLEMAFYILYIGLTTSAVCFVTELFIFHSCTYIF